MKKPHKCESHEQWLMSNHYYCACGHVEWVHHVNGCSHCNCAGYNGEPRPQTEFEKAKWTKANEEQAEGRFNRK